MVRLLEPQEHLWQVYEEYQEEGGLIKPVDTDCFSREYNLRDPIIQNQIFIQWLKVNTEPQALSWVRDWGYPTTGLRNGVETKQILEYAEIIRLLDGLFNASQLVNENVV